VASFVFSELVLYSLSSVSMDTGSIALKSQQKGTVKVSVKTDSTQADRGAKGCLKRLLPYPAEGGSVETDSLMQAAILVWQLQRGYNPR
jgi:hypothetical protein